MQPDALSSSLAFLRRALLRHKFEVLLFFVTVLAVTAVITYLAPRSYRSRAKLLVRLGRENVTLDPTATMGQAPVVAVPSSRETEINSVIEILNSQILLEKVVDSIGPDAILRKAPPAPLMDLSSQKEDPPPQLVIDDRYRAVALLGKKLDMEAVKKSNIVALSYEGPSPQTCQAVVSRLLDFFLERHVHVHRTPGAAKFMAEQTNRLREELTKAEDELRQAKEATGLVSPEGQRLGLINRLSKLDEDQAQTTSNLAAVEAEVLAMRERLSVLPATQVTAATKGFPGQAADTMRAQLFTLQVREQELAAKHPAGHPEVQQIRKQLAAAKEILDREDPIREQVTTGPSRLHEEIQLALKKQESLLASLKGRAEAISRQLEQGRRDLKQLAADEVRINRLQREVDLRAANYRKYSESQEQAQIDRALEEERISNISVVQPATYDVKAVRPSVLMNMALGFGFAAAGSLGLAVLLEQWATRKSRQTSAMA